MHVPNVNQYRNRPPESVPVFQRSTSDFFFDDDQTYNQSSLVFVIAKNILDMAFLLSDVMTKHLPGTNQK
jgi:hypothetical protein